MAAVVNNQHGCEFRNEATAPRASSVKALKSLLSVPTSSPQSVTASGKTAENVAKHSEKGVIILQNTPPSAKKAPRASSPQQPSSEKVTRSTKKSRKKKTEALAPPSFFAGSAFQNSPDPVSIPMPSFDDEEPETLDFGSDASDNSSKENTPTPDTKTILLRRLLKVEK